MFNFMYKLGHCTPKDSDTCLQTGSNWSDRYTCSHYATDYHCKTYPKDFERCCPISCGVENFTEEECNRSPGRGKCIYPNDAQCPENGKLMKFLSSRIR